MNISEVGHSIINRVGKVKKNKHSQIVGKKLSEITVAGFDSTHDALASQGKAIVGLNKKINTFKPKVIKEIEERLIKKMNGVLPLN